MLAFSSESLGSGALPYKGRGSVDLYLNDAALLSSKLDAKAGMGSGF